MRSGHLSQCDASFVSLSNLLGLIQMRIPMCHRFMLFHWSELTRIRSCTWSGTFSASKSFRCRLCWNIEAEKAVVFAGWGCSSIMNGPGAETVIQYSIYLIFRIVIITLIEIFWIQQLIQIAQIRLVLKDGQPSNRSRLLIVLACWLDFWQCFLACIYERFYEDINKWCLPSAGPQRL